MNTYILLFGVTGDLSKRMLLPSIEFLLSNKKIENIKIFGVSRRTIDVNEVLNASLGDDYKNSNVAKNIESIVLDSDLEDYIAFKNNLNLKKEDQLLIYLSVPPANALKYVEFLGKAGLNSNNVKLMLEKPFGVDYDSANNFLKIIDTYYNENQVYKIDHYLAKANAQKLINIYRRSETFKHIWNKDFIDKIEVVANESIDIQGRSVFYDQTGALRDFIQGHLFELLLLTICDIDGNTIENRINVAKSLNLVENKAIRGQYIGYEQEVGHSSNIETYASVLLNFNNEK
jgi:glucose-6-phosphate 1-dehydrogenase